MKYQNRQTHSEKNTPDWLEPLRHHSWEMELLLTGFVLIGLFQLPGILENFREDLWMKIEGDAIIKSYALSLPVNVVLVGIRVMTINLVLLLLLRGFWIGIIGLSSAFPKGINLNRLSFSERFASYLKRKKIDAEQLIVKLDHICSSIFALSFLVFFITLSIGLFLVQLQVIQSVNSMVTAKIEGGNNLYIILNILIVLISLFYFLGGLLKLVDFITVGVLKKIKKSWFAKPYFYISRYFSMVTLAFAYRPIYYFLASNFPRRNIQFVLLIYLVISLVIISGLRFSSDHIYYPQYFTNDFEISYNEYENLRPSDKGMITDMMIQSDVIRGDYIRLFIPYKVNDNKKLEKLCPGIRPVMKRFRSDIGISFGDESHAVTRTDVKKVLDCFKSFYTISINDSVYTDLKILFYRHPNNNEPGLVTHIPAAHLKPGFHELKVLEKGSEVPEIIQFWKE